MNLRSRFKLAYNVVKLMRSQWWDDARIRAYQSEKLRTILCHARREIPHYRRSVDARSETDPFELLQHFPILQKADLQNDPASFRWQSFRTEDLQHSRTSGSTGEPTTTYFDDHSWLICKYGLKARRVLNAATPLGQRLLAITESSDKTHETLAHVSIADRVFSTMHLSVDDPVHINVAKLLDFGPTMIYGYPSYLTYLGESIHKTGRPVAVVPVIFTSSEVLTPVERQHLQQLFGGHVTDIYGSTEFKEIAVQCEQGKYHINFESVYVESYTDPDAGHPRILLTTLLNKAMPLIRFDIGDHADFGRGPCPCGRDGPHLLQPRGRVAEMLQFPEGTAVTPFVLTTAIGAYPEIKNYTIVHDAPGEIRIRVFAEPQLDDQRRSALKADVARRLPFGILITIELLEERLPAGKRAVVSRAF